MCLQLPDLALFLGRCWQPNSGTVAETLWVSQCWQQAGEQKMIPVPSGVGIWTQPNVLGPAVYPEPLRHLLNDWTCRQSRVWWA